MFKRFGHVRRYASSINSSRTVNKPSRSVKVALYTSSIVGGLLTYDYLFQESTGTRTLKAFYTLSRIGLDYKFNFNESNDIAKLHERNADRLFNLLNDNKGLYIKVGQQIANQSSIFPKPFQEKFGKLYDSAATDPWSKIDQLLKQELGNDYYDRYFDYIEKEPIASASIAQVHKAKLKTTGEIVALKIQHYYISKQINADLLTYKLFTWIYELSFDIPTTFMANYIATHLKEEVDFLNELKNSEECRDLISKDKYLNGKIHIPKTFPQLTTKKLLTAEWCQGDSLVDYDKLKSKFSTKKIMKDYLELFAKMIFQWGFVHSDPHPGNLLVRINSETSKQQLVLLDHGLYVRLPERVRRDYCTLWKSLFELNDKELKKIAISWGIGSEQSDMFATFALLKPYHKTTEQLSKLSKFERENYMKNNFKKFFQDTEKFPLELIFLGRTMRMVQLLNQRYRAPVNRINLFTKEAVKGFYLNNFDTASSEKKYSTLSSYFRYSVFLLVMALSDLTFQLTKFSQFIFGTKNLEDVLQAQMAQQMKEMGVENPDNIDLLSG